VGSRLIMRNLSNIASFVIGLVIFFTIVLGKFKHTKGGGLWFHIFILWWLRLFQQWLWILWLSGGGLFSFSPY
jgi:hypothetical protein